MSMSSPRNLIICEYCDAVYQRTPVQRHQRALCTRCGGVLYRHGSLGIQQRLALSVTGAVLLVFANLYPVMTIGMQGLTNSATLWDSVLILSSGSITFIALVMALAIIFAPVLQIALLCWVLSFALAGRRAPGFAMCMRCLEGLALCLRPAPQAACRTGCGKRMPHAPGSGPAPYPEPAQQPFHRLPLAGTEPGFTYPAQHRLRGLQFARRGRHRR